VGGQKRGNAAFPFQGKSLWEKGGGKRGREKEIGFFRGKKEVSPRAQTRSGPEKKRKGGKRTSLKSKKENFGGKKKKVRLLLFHERVGAK